MKTIAPLFLFILIKWCVCIHLGTLHLSEKVPSPRGTTPTVTATPDEFFKPFHPLIDCPGNISFSTSLMGEASALHSNTMIIGGYLEDWDAVGVNGIPSLSAADSGAAFVFNRDPLTREWTGGAYLKASNTGINDGFGSALAVFENTVVVTAPGEDGSIGGIDSPDDDGGVNTGAAYIYYYDDASDEWSLVHKVKAEAPLDGDRFGAFGVALHDDFFSINGGFTGLQIFRRVGPQGSNWTYDRLLSTVDYPSIGIGRMSMDGDLQGNRLLAVSNAMDEVYVFENTVSTPSWTDAPFISDYSRTIDGDMSLSGSILAVTSSGANESYAIIHRRDAIDGTWSFDFEIEVPYPFIGTFLGSVSLSGTALLVGFPLDDSLSAGANGSQDQGSDPNANTGSALLYQRRVAEDLTVDWPNTGYFKHFSPTPAGSTWGGDRCGTGVTIFGNTIQLGCPNDDSQSCNPGVGGNFSDDSNPTYNSGCGLTYIVDELFCSQVTVPFGLRDQNAYCRSLLSSDASVFFLPEASRLDGDVVLELPVVVKGALTFESNSNTVVNAYVGDSRLVRGTSGNVSNVVPIFVDDCSTYQGNIVVNVFSQNGFPSEQLAVPVVSTPNCGSAPTSTFTQVDVQLHDGEETHSCDTETSYEPSGFSVLLDPSTCSNSGGDGGGKGVDEYLGLYLAGPAALCIALCVCIFVSLVACFIVVITLVGGVMGAMRMAKYRSLAAQAVPDYTSQF